MPNFGDPLTAGTSQAIQTQQVGPRGTAAMLARKPKKKKPEESTEPPAGTQHWSQTPSTASILTRRKK